MNSNSKLPPSKWRFEMIWGEVGWTTELADSHEARYRFCTVCTNLDTLSFLNHNLTALFLHVDGHWPHDYDVL